MKKITVSFVIVFSFFSTAFAATYSNESIFRSLVQPTMPTLTIPKPVRLVLPIRQKYDVMVLEEGSDLAEGNYQKTLYSKVAWKVQSASEILGAKESLVDNNLKTFAEFDYDSDEGIATVVLKADRIIEASRLSFILDENVARPHALEVIAVVNSVERTVVAKRDFAEYGWESYSFPKTLTDELRIRVWHSQPLRVLEIGIDSENIGTSEVGEEITWLARPNKKYTVYYNAESVPILQKKEIGSLGSGLNEDDLISLVFAGAKENPKFVFSDSDEDGVPNVRDNCVFIPNPDQVDIDKNGRGDICEDFDRDGVMNSVDNCPEHANANQSDEDGDKIGDACDNEESRTTEKLPWLPWAAMAAAGIGVGFLIYRTVRSQKNTLE